MACDCDGCVGDGYNCGSAYNCIGNAYYYVDDGYNSMGDGYGDPSKFVSPLQVARVDMCGAFRLLASGVGSLSDGMVFALLCLLDTCDLWGWSASIIREIPLS